MVDIHKGSDPFSKKHIADKTDGTYVLPDKAPTPAIQKPASGSGKAIDGKTLGNIRGMNGPNRSGAFYAGPGAWLTPKW